MGKDEELARDVTQDAFVKLWEKKDTVDMNKVKSYLFTTVHHKLIDVFRKDKRYESVDLSKVNDSVHQQAHDLQAVLHQALATLPELQRSVILLRDYEGYAYEEIAELTKLSLAQVKVYIFRGRQKLKQYIGSMEAII